MGIHNVCTYLTCLFGKHAFESFSISMLVFVTILVRYTKESSQNNNNNINNNNISSDRKYLLMKISYWT